MARGDTDRSGDTAVSGDLQQSHKLSDRHPGILSQEVALRAFSICAAEVEELGLRGLKARTKAAYRKFLMENHPDKRKYRYGKNFVKSGVWIKRPHGPGANHISYWFRKYREIMDLQYLPMTLFNFEKVFELQKGFKNTADVDFGLNGPDEYGKSTELLSGQVQPVY